MPYKLSVDLPAVNAGYDYAVLTGKSSIFHTEVMENAVPVKLSELS